MGIGLLSLRDPHVMFPFKADSAAVVAVSVEVALNSLEKSDSDSALVILMSILFLLYILTGNSTALSPYKNAAITLLLSNQIKLGSSFALHVIRTG